MSSSLYHRQEHVILSQHLREYPRATSQCQEDGFHIAIKQYTPLINLSPQAGDVTIIAAQSLGWPKELYEPLWDELLNYSTRSGALRIRNIWFAEPANLGASGMLNEARLGNDPSWHDHARDLLHMVNHFRTQMVRPIIGIGHSMGATTIADLALLHPRLMTTVVSIEPYVMRSPNEGLKTGDSVFPYTVTFKRDIWPSREAARDAFRRNAFFKSWDPRVFELWIQHGLRELPTLVYPNQHHPDESTSTATRESKLGTTMSSGTKLPPQTSRAVTLTTTKHQESFTVARPCHPLGDQPLSSFAPTPSSHPELGPIGFRNPTRSFYRPETYVVWRKLVDLRPTCLYVFGAASAIARLQKRDELLAITGTGLGGSGGVGVGAVKQVVIARSGHFAPFEKPGPIAEQAGEWLDSELARWRKEEVEWVSWAAKDQVDKSTVDEEWKRWMKIFYEGEKRAPSEVSGETTGTRSKL